MVTTRPQLKREIAHLCDEEKYVGGAFPPFISEARVLVIPCTSEAAYHRRYQEADKVNDDGSEIVWPVPFWHMDIGCSIMILLLGVVNEGLAAAFAGIPEPEDYQKLRELLGIPAEVI